MNREDWLNAVAAGLAPHFEALDAPLPDKIRIAIGFTSCGQRGRRIGECWDSSASGDGHFEILIRPDLLESVEKLPSRIADILAHELVHAAVGIPAGHGPAFRRVAVGLGLTGQMTATVAGPAFLELIGPILEQVGPLPHAPLDKLGVSDRPTTRPKTQTKRHIKCVCKQCGYQVRTSRKWIDDVGLPCCPTHGSMIEV